MKLQRFTTGVLDDNTTQSGSPNDVPSPSANPTQGGPVGGNDELFCNQTLLGVNRLLTDDHYRAKVIRQVKDPFIRAFWAEEYENYDERFKREAIAPIQNKIGQFLLNPVVRNILGQVKKKVDIPFVMDNGRLFIANLSKGQLGHDKANLLGSLLVTTLILQVTAINSPRIWLKTPMNPMCLAYTPTTRCRPICICWIGSSD